LFHHSDAGSQYTSFDYTQALNDHQVLASIGTIGDAYDNALVESEALDPRIEPGPARTAPNGSERETMAAGPGDGRPNTSGCATAVR
jgi:transposase InsO family protein